MLVVPPMEGKRWWIMQIIDAWNDVPAAPGLAHARRQGRELRARRPELQRHAARRPGGDPRRYQSRRARRADLHRREGRLRRGPQDSGPVQADPALAMEGRGHEATRRPPACPSSRAWTPRRRFPCRCSSCRPSSSSDGCANCWSTTPPARPMRRSWRGSPSSASSPARSSRPQAFDADTRKAIDEGIAAAQQAIRDRRVEDGRDGQRLADRPRPRPLRNEVPVPGRVDVLRRGRQPRRRCALSADA